MDLYCPWCKPPVKVSRLHMEGDYVLIACDICEGHGPRIKIKNGKITALTEEWAREEYGKWQKRPSLWQRILRSFKNV